MTPKNLRVVKGHLSPVIQHQQALTGLVQHVAATLFGEDAEGTGPPLASRIEDLETRVARYMRLVHGSLLTRLRWLLTGHLPD